MKEAVLKLVASPAIIKTAIILAACLVLFGAAHLFAARYNKGYSRRNLIASRVCITVDIVLVILWVFGIV